MSKMVLPDRSLLEQRRRQGMLLLAAQVWPAEVARKMGVSRTSVARWKKDMQKYGEHAYKARAVYSKRNPAISETQLAKILASRFGANENTFLWSSDCLRSEIAKQAGIILSQRRLQTLLRSFEISLHRQLEAINARLGPYFPRAIEKARKRRQPIFIELPKTRQLSLGVSIEKGITIRRSITPIPIATPGNRFFLFVIRGKSQTDDTVASLLEKLISLHSKSPLVFLNLGNCMVADRKAGTQTHNYKSWVTRLRTRKNKRYRYRDFERDRRKCVPDFFEWHTFEVEFIPE